MRPITISNETFDLDSDSVAPNAFRELSSQLEPNFAGPIFTLYDNAGVFVTSLESKRHHYVLLGVSFLLIRSDWVITQ